MKPAVIDFGIPNPMKQEMRLLTTEELCQAVGERDMTLITIIPQLMTAIVMDEVLEAYERGRDQRLYDVKALTRKMRQDVSDYANHVSHVLREKAQSYNIMLDDYEQAAALTRLQVLVKLREDARNQITKDEQFAAHVCFALLMYQAMQDLEREYNSRLSRAFGQGVTKPTEPAVRDIADYCRRIGTLGYAFRPSQPAITGIRVMMNHAYYLAEKYYRQFTQGR